ncbi:hypothetical protein Mapa_001723 [Marchantia paleacea]|nr:hypothetical protein Mapa_001723 [Marchantia paleacea]
MPSDPAIEPSSLYLPFVLPSLLPSLPSSLPPTTTFFTSYPASSSTSTTLLQIPSPLQLCPPYRVRSKAGRVPNRIINLRVSRSALSIRHTHPEVGVSFICFSFLSHHNQDLQ